MYILCIYIYMCVCIYKYIMLFIFFYNLSFFYIKLFKYLFSIFIFYCYSILFIHYILTHYTIYKVVDQIVWCMYIMFYNTLALVITTTTIL